MGHLVLFNRWGGSRRIDISQIWSIDVDIMLKVECIHTSINAWSSKMYVQGTTWLIVFSLLVYLLPSEGVMYISYVVSYVLEVEQSRSCRVMANEQARIRKKMKPGHNIVMYSNSVYWWKYSTSEQKFCVSLWNDLLEWFWWVCWLHQYTLFFFLADNMQPLWWNYWVDRGIVILIVVCIWCCKCWERPCWSVPLSHKYYSDTLEMHDHQSSRRARTTLWELSQNKRVQIGIHPNFNELDQMHQAIQLSILRNWGLSHPTVFTDSTPKRESNWICNRALVLPHVLLYPRY